MSGITLLVEDGNWRKTRGLRARLTRGAAAAQKAVRLKGGVTILLSDNKKLRALNRDFRGKDKPTNVLSFASGEKDHAGDIALAFGVMRDEAKAAGKSLADHAVHLAVHGVLHLAGHDHERAADAKRMEALEVKILTRLGIADPYEVLP